MFVSGLYPGFSPVEFRLSSPNVERHYLFSFSFSVASLALLAFFSAFKRFLSSDLLVRSLIASSLSSNCIVSLNASDSHSFRSKLIKIQNKITNL